MEELKGNIIVGIQRFSIVKVPGLSNIYFFNAIKQRKQLLIFLIGGCTLLYLIRFLVQALSTTIYSIREQLKCCYLMEVIKKERRNILLSGLKAMMVVVATIVIWKKVAFSLYIDPNNIPEDPTNLSLVLGMMRENLIAFLNPQNQSMLPINKILSFYKSVSKYSYLLGLGNGLVLLTLIIKVQYKLNPSVESSFTRLTTYLMVSSVFSILLIGLIGLPVSLPLSDIITIYACLTFLNSASQPTSI